MSETLEKGDLLSLIGVPKNPWMRRVLSFLKKYEYTQEELQLIKQEILNSLPKPKKKKRGR